MTHNLPPCVSSVAARLSAAATEQNHCIVGRVATAANGELTVVLGGAAPLPMVDTMENENVHDR
jgi:fructose-specific component phosphotransferase system IIB-like protein